MIALFIALTVSTIPNVAERTIIKKQFENILNDERTARFKWTKVINQNSYCAYVNAKNSFGAYTGWERYFISTTVDFDTGVLKSAGVPVITSNDRDASLACSIYGYTGYKISDLPEL